MTRDQLMGTWRHAHSVFQLHADGSAIIRTTDPDGQTQDEHATWEHVDATHWTLRLLIPPAPDIPGLEDGAVEVIEYEIESETPGWMSLSQFDVEFPEQWRKVAGPVA